MNYICGFYFSPSSQIHIQRLSSNISTIPHLHISKPFLTVSKLLNLNCPFDVLFIFLNLGIFWSLITPSDQWSLPVISDHLYSLFHISCLLLWMVNIRYLNACIFTCSFSYTCFPLVHIRFLFWFYWLLFLISPDLLPAAPSSQYRSLCHLQTS